MTAPLRNVEAMHLAELVDRLIKRREHDKVAPSPFLEHVYDAIRFMAGQHDFGLAEVAHADGMPSALTIERVADELMTSESTVRRLIRDGELIAFKMLGSTRVRPEDLRAYIDGKAAAVAAMQREIPTNHHGLETR